MNSENISVYWRQILTFASKSDLKRCITQLYSPFEKASLAFFKNIFARWMERTLSPLSHAKFYPHISIVMCAYGSENRHYFNFFVV